MAGASRGNGDVVRRTGMSPRPKGRENAKDTLCRNVTIYGHCRFEDKGCVYNHDMSRMHSTESAKKKLNVDSPSFTPAAVAQTQPSSTTPSLSVNGLNAKPSGFSPRAVSAAPFKPKCIGEGQDVGTVTRQPYNPAAIDWPLGQGNDVQDFVPSTQQSVATLVENTNPLHQGLYDQYATQNQSFMGSNNLQTTQSGQVNPYAQDSSSNSNTFYQSTNYTQPLNYHLYTSLAPHRENLQPHQRSHHDFFLSDTLREELQRKAAATMQTLPSSNLPVQVEHFHSLVPLDNTNQRNTALFGYPSWVYKAVSGKDGHTYVLRRIEGYRAFNERAIQSIAAWKRVTNSSMVRVHEAFTNRNFGDASLFIVTDYHPLSKTLAEIHFRSTPLKHGSRGGFVPADTLWGYMGQLANAVKAIHSMGLAARLIDPTKVILTSKNRVRLSGCGALDIIHFEASRPLLESQQEDLVQLGRLLLGLGVGHAISSQNLHKAVEQFSRSYAHDLKEAVLSLVGTNSQTRVDSIDRLIINIAPRVMTIFDQALHEDDQLQSELAKEIENGRLFRVATKLSFITERPEYSNDRQWAETGERYPIKLFRDYVFHQVDQLGNPVLDLGHVVACLNKLDTASEEKVTLTTRDEQFCIIVTYKEMKRALEGAYSDLMKASRRTQG